jgi:hypothetical protein
MKVLPPIALATLLATSSAFAQVPPYEPPPPSPRAHVIDVFEAGYAAQSLYGIPISGADLSAFLGADLGSWDIGVELEGVLGKTDGGLGATTVTLGGLAEAHVDRFRIGGGVRVGGFNVSRATEYASLFSLSAGAFGRLSFDVVPFDDAGNRAIFLVAKGSIDTVGTPLFCATIGAGVRF